jgi:hypothetical protein
MVGISSGFQLLVLAMPSIAHLKNCAEKHLHDFVNSKTRSFVTYDRQGGVSVFGPLDALAPALLDARLGPKEVNQMFSEDQENPYYKLRVAIEKCLQELASITNHGGVELDFANADLSGDSGPWALVEACYTASNSTANIKASKVSKMLHRKQPTFIPIIDSRLRSFYGLSKSPPSKYWTALQVDYRANRDLLDQLGKGVVTSEGKPISSLRVVDIVIWEHVVTGCDKAK